GIRKVGGHPLRVGCQIDEKLTKLLAHEPSSRDGHLRGGTGATLLRRWQGRKERVVARVVSDRIELRIDPHVGEIRIACLADARAIRTCGLTSWSFICSVFSDSAIAASKRRAR